MCEKNEQPKKHKCGCKGDCSTGFNEQAPKAEKPAEKKTCCHAKKKTPTP